MSDTIYVKQNKIEDLIDIWVELAEVGKKYGAVSLGVGIPYLEPPNFLIQNLIDATNEGHNHYTCPNGHPEARELISKHYSPQFNRTIDPSTEIIMSNGANGAIDWLLQALITSEDDEVILIEPMFPEYMTLAQYARGTKRYVPYKVQDDGNWNLDLECLKETLNTKSRVIILNFPHNPTGKVPNLDELTEISEILEDFPNWFVLSDHVYDYLTYDDHKHHVFATIGDNWKKTVSIYSGGKLLCWTGWRVGWAIGPQEILREATVINETSTYGQNVPSQVAVARSLKTAYTEEYKDGKTFIEYLRNDFKKTHDLLVDGINEIDLPIKPIPALGGFFILADVSELRDLIPKKYFKQEEYEDDRCTTISKNDFGDPVPLDLAVSRWLVMEMKVVTLPGSFFFDKASPTKTDKYIRLAFWRGEEIIEQALQNLKS